MKQLPDEQTNAYYCIHRIWFEVSSSHGDDLYSCATIHIISL